MKARNDDKLSKILFSTADFTTFSVEFRLNLDFTYIKVYHLSMIFYFKHLSIASNNNTIWVFQKHI